jgi:CrcB protein
MTSALNYLWIAIGGALGSVARFGMSGLIAARFGGKAMWGTLFVNVTGSFLIGIFSAWSQTDGRLAEATTLRQFLIVGICGGYTTFSAFSVQTLDLMRAGNWLAAMGNVLGSVLACLVAVWLGHLLGSTWRGN